MRRVALTNPKNSYIDFLRGVAAIGIIAIHTAFWSGQSYTSPWFWNITLLLDVPFFSFYQDGDPVTENIIKKTEASSECVSV